MHKITFLARCKRYGKWKRYSLISDADMSSENLYKILKEHVVNSNPESNKNNVEIMEITIKNN